MYICICGHLIEAFLCACTRVCVQAHIYMFLGYYFSYFSMPTIYLLFAVSKPLFTVHV